MDAKLEKELKEIKQGMQAFRYSEPPSKAGVKTFSETLSASTVRSSKWDKAGAGSWEINFTDPSFLGRIPTFVRILLTTAGTLRLYHMNRADLQTFGEGLTANIAFEASREGLTGVRVTPSAYPSTIRVYASSTRPKQTVKLGDDIKEEIL